MDNTRERLIESTRELLWERGYVGTSPRAIQQRAGVGQGSMYHHFTGKPALALVAVRRTAEDMRDKAEGELSGPGTAYERIEAYLLREREVLRGCPVGRLTQDPDVITDAVLRQPLEETFDWLRRRLGRVLAEGRERGELASDLDPVATAAAIVATLQGGYVLARAAASVEPFEDAVKGVLGLLAARVTS
ncbi:TetR/AcrR family transcriptional regulator [Actinoallomurus sp. NPDC052274]|uniref:TetR/AcrR family transcriptional regulator n=1 Tax=Actinoallomurus sp. NPDC052274 TaxID=3155420 RepID=UPI003413AB62